MASREPHHHRSRRDPPLGREHDGRPASVAGTAAGDAAGVLRVDFPGGAGEDQLEHIPWEEWFDKFEKENLAFLYQEHKASGEDSTFFKLVSR